MPISRQLSNAANASVLARFLLKNPVTELADLVKRYVPVVPLINSLALAWLLIFISALADPRGVVGVGQDTAFHSMICRITYLALALQIANIA